MAKTLPVRFCGGCRVAFDRGAYLRDLLRLMNETGGQVTPDYDTAPENTPVGLLICGCPTLCAANEMPLPDGWHVAGPDGSFDHAVHPPEDVAGILLKDITGF